MLLYLRSSQKLLTRVDRHRARQGPITIDFRVFRLCRRTRAFIVAARFIVSKASLGTRWHTEPPPTFPFRKSQCQTARQTDVFTPFFNETPLSQLTSRSGVGAGYRSGLPPRQTLKSRKKRFFCTCCGQAFPPVFCEARLSAGTLDMGRRPDFSPVPLICQVERVFAAQKACFWPFAEHPATQEAPGFCARRPDFE